MMASSYNNDDTTKFSRLRNVYFRLLGIYIDRTTLYPKSRWFLFLVLLVLVIIRMYIVNGFFVVAYALGIYLLNLFIGFLTPQVDIETDTYILPVRLNGTRALILSLIATFIPPLDFPVFWPVLLLYFLFLFVLTMKQQIKNMVQHKYIPFSWGKQTYGDITRNNNAPKPKKINAFGKPSGMSFPSMKSQAHRS